MLITNFGFIDKSTCGIEITNFFFGKIKAMRLSLFFVNVATLMQFVYVAITIESFIQELTTKFPTSHVMDAMRICCA